MPLWQLLYLQYLDIHCCGCSFLDQCIYIFLFSWLADAFQPVCHVQLHLHLAFSGTWGYYLRKYFICIPRFLCPADASNWNYASTTCSFYNLQIPPSKILHQPALSMPCGYSPIKILHLQSPKIHYRRYPLKFHPHPRQTKLSSLIHQICDNVL